MADSARRCGSTASRRPARLNWLLVAALIGLHRAARRFARLPLVLPQRAAELSCQFGGSRGGGGFSAAAALRRQRRRLLRRRRLVGRRRRVGELVMELSHRIAQRISAAIRAAEARTSGEIVCVLARALGRRDGAADPGRGAWRHLRCRGCWSAFTAPAGSADPVAAGRRVPRARRAALPAAACASRCCRASAPSASPIARRWSSSSSAASRARRTAPAS